MSEGLHPGVHPDPDVLNAFAEGALPEHERVECLGHLADCAQCREVVFLAQKAAEMDAPVAVQEVPVSFWQRLSWPRAVVFAIAAAVVAVFSFGLYRMIRPIEPQPQVTANASVPTETAPAAKLDEQTPASRPVPSKASPRAVSKASEQQSTPPAATAPVTAEPPAVVPAAPPPAPAPATAAAQTPKDAGVTGTIIDPSGAVIANAHVELKNEDTGVSHTSASDEHGQYSVTGLEPGRYDFSVTVMGFKKFVRPGIDVQPQEMAKLDSKLDVGAASESVSVTSVAPLLKTESGEASHPADAYTLPDKSTPVSVAAKDKLVVAADATGALLLSENAGKNWTRVRPAWKGKVVRVAVRASAMFELTTDPPSTWVSTDGRNWSESRAAR